MATRLAVLVLCLILPAAACAGQELQELLTRAVEHDAKLKALSGLLANTLLGIEKLKLAPGFQMKLSTGEAKLGYSFNPRAGDPPWLVYAEPSGALLLGRKTETELSLQVPLAVAFGDGSEIAALPKISVRQPLDRLFGAEKLSKAQDRQNFLAAEKARLDVLDRFTEIERSLLAQLSALAALEQGRRGQQQELARAREALQQALTLKSFAPGSARQRQLEFAVSRLERELELSELRRSRAWRELERLVGGTIDALPADLPEPVLRVPEPAQAERNPAVYLARLAVELEQARLDEERQPAKPRFFLGGALQNARNQFTDRRETTVGTALEGVFDDFSVSAGIGGIIETGTVFLSAGLSWSLRDPKIESLDLRERENALEVSRFNLAAAREAFLGSREMLGLEVEELELRRRNLQEECELADLRLAEAGLRLEQGLIAPEEVEALRWEREKLDYAARVLQLDGLLLRSRLEALTAQDGEKR